jgi:DHA2 family multidrug resistance protein
MVSPAQQRYPLTQGVNPWLVTLSVMLPTFMEVLDTAIASVALPYIAGSLSASNSEATWVLTSYLVANAVILPASNWFARRFGRKNFLLFCVIVFTVASFFCGAAPSLSIILLARVLQGASGGALQPLSQSILLESFPVKQRSQAMAACRSRILRGNKNRAPQQCTWATRWDPRTAAGAPWA